MVPKKRQSKRKTTKLRTKIDKKVREHNRKVRKEAKLHPKRRSSTKKDPGIPNSFPFKAKLLEEIQQQQQQLKAKSPKTIQDLARECQEKDQNYHIQQDDDEQDSSESNKIKDEHDSSRRAFFRDFQQVISQSDVIVQVLDARDPLGCRDKSVERTVLQSGKRLVLLLNKIDLIPRENAQEWLKYLRQEFPTIPFRSSTQLQRENLSISTSEGCCAGVSEVLSLLKNYCRTDSNAASSLKLSITVGVVGMPSVGKSSFINSLKRQKACQVGANAGTTRSLQLVSLDRNIRLLDSPGIIWQNSTASGSKRQLLRNATSSTNHEPEEVAEAILSHCNYALLAKIYAIPLQEDAMMLSESTTNRSQELLVKLAQHLGMMKRGAVLDLQAAAKRLACDWNSGKIPFYSTVPSAAERRAAFEGETQVVFGGQLAEPFHLMEQ